MCLKWESPVRKKKFKSGHQLTLIVRLVKKFSKNLSLITESINHMRVCVIKSSHCLILLLCKDNAWLQVSWLQQNKPQMSTSGVPCSLLIYPLNQPDAQAP